MNGRILLCAIVLCTASLSPLRAADRDPEVPYFFAARLTTDVHRQLISNTASAYAQVNCMALVTSEGRFDFSDADRTLLIDALKLLAPADAAELRLVLRYGFSIDVPPSSKAEIRSALEAVGQTAGFEKVRTSEMSTSAEWEEAYAVIGKFEEEEADEPIVESELVRSYPLRTKLSKLVFDDADCVVEIHRPFDGRQQHLSEPLREAIKQAVESMKLGAKKGKLKYDVSTTTAGEKVVERLFSSFSRMPSEAKLLAMELGFEATTFSHSPNGGAPEKLVGKQAPAFTLATLDGTELQLESYIANRPALVTFWGVACGPCCREAPHLSNMHEKYGARFAIVAVNGYDETQEVVSAFAEKMKLQHPIVLNGRSVADDLYFVGAYPTTFWINRQGIVEDYVVGFDSAEALEARIVQALKD